MARGGAASSGDIASASSMGASAASDLDLPCTRCGGSGRCGIFRRDGLGLVSRRCRCIRRWLVRVTDDGCALRNAPEEVKQNREVALAAFRALGCHLSDHSTTTREVVLAAVLQRAGRLEMAPDELKADRSVVLAAVSANGCSLQHASEALQADADVVATAVEQDPWAFKYAAESLREDRDLALAVVRKDWRITRDKCFPDALRHDRELALLVVNQNPAALQLVPLELRGDSELVLAAVARSPIAFQHAAACLKADKDVVLAAVSLHGVALQYASEVMRADQEVVLVAVTQNAQALQFASVAARRDPDVCVAAVAQDWSVVREVFFPSSDRDVILALVTRCAFPLQYAPDSMRADRDVVLAAVSKHGGSLRHASEGLRADRVVVLAAVRQHGFALRYASRALQKDRDLCLAAVTRADAFPLRYAHDALRGDHELARDAVVRNVSAIECLTGGLQEDPELQFLAGCAAEEMRADRDVVMAAVGRNGSALKHASEDLRNDREVMLAAMRSNPDAIQYGSATLQAGEADLVRELDGIILVLRISPRQADGLVTASASEESSQETTLVTTRADPSKPFVRLVATLSETLDKPMQRLQFLLPDGQFVRRADFERRLDDLDFERVLDGGSNSFMSEDVSDVASDWVADDVCEVSPSQVH